MEQQNEAMASAFETRRRIGRQSFLRRRNGSSSKTAVAAVDGVEYPTVEAVSITD